MSLTLNICIRLQSYLVLPHLSPFQKHSYVPKGGHKSRDAKMAAKFTS
eukprot:UN16700